MSGHKVAIKKPFQSAINDLLWEAKVLIALGTHNHIVGYCGGLQMDGVPSLVLELADSTLANEIQFRRSIPEAEAVRHMHSLLSALAHTTSLGLMHLDVHTRNLLLYSTPKGVVLKLADFGIARTRVDGVVALPAGTPGFRAPEWIMSSSSSQEERSLQWVNNHALDIWAAGKVFMTMLLGDKLSPPHGEIAEVAAALALVEDSRECATPTGEEDSGTLKRPDPSVLKRVICQRAGSGRRHKLARDWLRGLASEATIQLIEQMLCREAALRPSPQELLDSSIFSDDSPIMASAADIPAPLDAPLARFEMTFPSECDDYCMPMYARVRRRPPGSPTDGTTPLRKEGRTESPGERRSAARRL